MSTHCFAVALLTILLYSASCFGCSEHSAHHKVHQARNASGHPGSSAQRISRSKIRTRLKDESKAAKPYEINVDSFGAKVDGRDDTKAFVRAWKKACSSTSKQVTFHVPAGKKYNLKPINMSGPCRSAITFNIHGTISASKDLADYKMNTRYWLIFENIKDLTVQGGGTIDGNGQVWWPKHCKKDKTRPCVSAATALTFTDCKNLRVSHLNFKNAQRMHLTFDDCINVEASNININAPGDSPNTDGIHVSGSKNVRIRHSAIHTGDDCISIVSGSDNVEATDIRCGPGHGISIGSLGKNGATDTVSNIKVNKAIITGADNGARIKSWQGGKGIAENIIFENIVMQDVKNPIIIDQFYCDKMGKCPEQKDAVKIKNIVFKNIKGVSSTEEGIRLNCSSSVPCEGIKLENIELTYKGGGSSLASCSNAKVSEMGKMSPSCPL